MREKFLLAIFALSCVLCCAFGLAACGEGDGHTHNYVRKYDETYHWRECTVSGCAAKTIDLTVHAYENNVCKDCGYVKGTDIPNTDNSSVKGYSYVFNDVRVESDGYDKILKEYLNEMRKGFVGATMSFYTDGTFSSTTGGYTATGTYSQTGSKLTLTVSGQSSELTVTANSIVQYMRLPLEVLPPAEETPDNPNEKPSETEPDYPEPTPETPALPEQSEGGEDYGEASDKARQAASSDNEIIIKIVYVKSSAAVAPPQGEEHTHTYNKRFYGYTETVHWRICDVCGDNGTTEPHSYDNDDEGGYCKVCGYYGHKHSFTQEVATSEYLAERATDCEHASKYYYSCTCGEYTDRTFEYGTGAHRLDYNFARSAGCDWTGNIEYWSCRTCEKYFSDENGINEITDKSSVILPARGYHVYDSGVYGINNGICVCGKLEHLDLAFGFALTEDGTGYKMTPRYCSDTVTGNICLPSQFNGLPVTELHSYSSQGDSTKGLFVRNKSITGVEIPSCVKTVGDYAFINCGLTELNIPSTVAHIGRLITAGCPIEKITLPRLDGSLGGVLGAGSEIFSDVIPPSLKTVIITGGESIPDSAFDSGYENSITEISLPGSITRIGNDAFKSCKSLITINFGDTKAQWNEINKGTNWNYNTGDYTVICTDGKLNKQGNEIE